MSPHLKAFRLSTRSTSAHVISAQPADPRSWAPGISFCGVCEHVCVCVFRHASVCVCACMSMSSLLTNPSHPSDTMTLSTLCFLSLSDWLPPRRDSGTHPNNALLSEKQSDLYTSLQRQRASALMAAKFTCSYGCIGTLYIKLQAMTHFACMCLQLPQ